MSAQTVYSLDMPKAVAGMVVDRQPGGMRGRYEASETLKAGRIAEYHTDGKLRPPQGTTLTRCQGMVPYIATKPSSNYAADGSIIPTLRKGLAWVEYSGTAPSAETAVNIRHASTDGNSEAQYRGTVTGAATSAVAGSEVSALEGVRCVEVDTTLSLALCEFNLPA